MPKFTPGLLVKNDLARYRFQSFDAATDSVDVPEHLDRRSEMLSSSNQGRTPQCAAYAMAGVAEYWNWKYNRVKQQIDPQPIYEYAKSIDGQPDEEGTTLEAVVRAAIALKIMPINPDSFRVVRNAADVKQAIHRYGVLLSGFLISEGWSRSRPNGWIEEGGNVLGGHAVVMMGYSEVENPQWYAAQNSWGEVTHGWRGFIRMSPAQFQREFMYGLAFDTF